MSSNFDFFIRKLGAPIINISRCDLVSRRRDDRRSLSDISSLVWLNHSTRRSDSEIRTNAHKLGWRYFSIINWVSNFDSVFGRSFQGDVGNVEISSLGNSHRLFCNINALFRSLCGYGSRSIKSPIFFQRAVENDSLTDHGDELKNTNGDQEPRESDNFPLCLCILLEFIAYGIGQIGAFLVASHRWFFGGCLMTLACLGVVTAFSAAVFGIPAAFWSLAWLW